MVIAVKFPDQSGLIFATAQVAYLTAMIIHLFITRKYFDLPTCLVTRPLFLSIRAVNNCNKLYLETLIKRMTETDNNCRGVGPLFFALSITVCYCILRLGGGTAMSYIGMCRCEGYGFQRVYSRIGYRNQRILIN